MRPLAEQLELDGVATLVPDLRSAVAGGPVHQRLSAEFVRALNVAGAAGPLVLVGHSGAGPLLPGFVEAADRPVAALVYLDADLPTPGCSWQDTAPTGLVEELQSRARSSRLPPWHLWFDADPLTELVPDAALRNSLSSEEPEVAAAFLTEARPDADWNGPAGYLQLSPPYAAVAAEAAERGWPVRRIETHHLAPVTRPSTLAEELLNLFTALSA
ncbi:hypothetical protein [Bounagaea algeriensis]